MVVRTYTVAKESRDSLLTNIHIAMKKRYNPVRQFSIVSTESSFIQIFNFERTLAITYSGMPGEAGKLELYGVDDFIKIRKDRIETDTKLKLEEILK